MATPGKDDIVLEPLNITAVELGEKIATASYLAFVVPFSHLTDSVAQTHDRPSPPLPPSIDQYVSYQQVVIKNATPWPFNYMRTKVDPGMFLVNPEWVAPFSVSAFTVVNKETDQGKTQGVGGGIVYALELDTKHQLDVAIGFAVSPTNFQELGIAFSRDIKDGQYAVTHEKMGVMTKDTYFVKTSDHVAYQFAINVADTRPDTTTVVKIDLVLYSSGT